MELNTRIHTQVGLSNPFLICDKCKSKVPYWHNPDRCNCDDEFFNYPCGHKAGTSSTCPTWSQVEGCSCKVPCKK